ncbi:MAG: toll/interleukin-1 receptor domain-containing protein [Terriglobia bacterium]
MSSQELEQGKAWVEKTIRNIARERGAEVTEWCEWHTNFDREVCSLRAAIGGAEKVWEFHFEQLEDAVNDATVQQKIVHALTESFRPDPDPGQQPVGGISVERKEDLSRLNSSPLVNLLAEGLDLSSDLKNDEPREFEIGYQDWYTSALLAVEKLLPLRAKEFGHLYDGQPRTDLNMGTYRIRDFLIGLVPHGKPYPEIKALTRSLVLQQIHILRSALSLSAPQSTTGISADPNVVPISTDWDLFICHASEDKESLVKPLAEKLRANNLQVWYDAFTLKVGDSLRKEIDRGLAHSRFGVVVLSPDFFKKNWPQYELDGLVTREMGGQKVILPVWHNVNQRDVGGYSLSLAGRLAAKSSDGIDEVVDMLVEAVRPRSDTNSAPHARGNDLQPTAHSGDDGPEVVIEYESNAKEERATRKAPLVVRNLRGGTAYRVQIRDIRNGSLTARFDLISHVPEGQSIQVTPKVEDANGTNPLFLDFVRVLEADYRDTSAKELFTPFRLPVHVSYSDINGRPFESECEIEFHYFHKTARTVFKRRT